MVKRPGVDDLLAVVTLGTLVALSVMEIRLVEFGSGTKIQFVSLDRLANFFNALTTQSLLYFWCVCLMRLHIAAFLPNLHNDSKSWVEMCLQTRPPDEKRVRVRVCVMCVLY
jgi:hypothetical protein